jgi:CxxC motif-containing protein (DUF1111 family)
MNDHRALSNLAAAVLGATALNAAQPADVQPEARSRGSFTTTVFSAQAYRQMLPSEDRKLIKQFADGRDAFDRRWIVPFLPGGPWGRGPVSNGEACADCHADNGRGRPPARADEPMRSMLVRLSIPGDDGHGGPKPHPDYGGQLNFQGVEGRVPGEGDAYVTWEEKRVSFVDGESMVLRAPTIEFKQLGFGPIGAEVMTSARVAPALIGLGLLEAVPEEAILTLAKQDKPHGIKGKPNYVWDIAAQRVVLGRFGLKANQPSLAQQTLTAFHQDLGVTSNMYPAENCTPVQTACSKLPSGGRPELSDSLLDPLLFYIRAGAVPARRDPDNAEIKQGEQLFKEAACAACHAPELKTGAYDAVPAVSEQTIHPYTDLLLHDMGEELADGRPDHQASGREWRTAPLWGLGLLGVVSGHTTLLHDGRARNALEAILWHGGEAEPSREAFLQMSKSQRDALLRFLDSL